MNDKQFGKGGGDCDSDLHSLDLGAGDGGIVSWGVCVIAS